MKSNTFFANKRTQTHITLTNRTVNVLILLPIGLNHHIYTTIIVSISLCKPMIDRKEDDR